MIRSPLAQFDIVCIIPLHWGNYEVSMTNLSLTVVNALVIGVFLLYIFFNGHLVPRN